MITRALRLFLCASLCFGINLTIRAAECFVYFGTTSEKNSSEGIYVARFDTDTGKLSPATLAAKITSPMFVNFLPGKPVLYAIGETTGAGGKTLGEVDTYTVDTTTGKLTFLNRQLSGGDALCYVLADATGKVALAASYRDGTVMTFPIHADGSLGERSSLIRHSGSSVHPRQKSPHAHNIDLDPANRFALVADLGIDQVLTYRFDPATATIVQQPNPFQTKPGAGPRHLAFDPAGEHVYIVNEIDNTVIAADYDAKTGHLKENQTLPLLPADFKSASTAAEIVIHPSGKFLYVSNRGYDSLSLFTVEPNTGRLTFVEHLRAGISHPRHFAIDPTGHWLLCANRDTDSIVICKIDPTSGHLTPIAGSITVPMPTCVKFLAR